MMADSSTPVWCRFLARPSLIRANHGTSRGSLTLRVGSRSVVVLVRLARRSHCGGAGGGGVTLIAPGPRTRAATSPAQTEEQTEEQTKEPPICTVGDDERWCADQVVLLVEGGLREVTRLRYSRRAVPVHSGAGDNSQDHSTGSRREEGNYA
jgi:hypothetical protein